MDTNLILTSKIFNGHFTDAEYHYQKASDLFDQVKASARDAHPDQSLLKIARAHGRASIVSVIAGCESLCLCLEKDFAERKIEAIPEQWIPRRWRSREYADWSVSTKLRFVPVLCCKTLKSPNEYYTQLARELSQFDEIVRVRRTLVHGSDVVITYRVGVKDGVTTMSEIPSGDNFWPITRISRDPRSLVREEVVTIYELVLKMCAQAVKYVGSGVSEKWLRDDSGRYGSQVITFRRGDVREEPAPQWVKLLLNIE